VFVVVVVVGRFGGGGASSLTRSDSTQRNPLTSSRRSGNACSSTLGPRVCNESSLSLDQFHNKIILGYR
jgi:hypothetical protein